MWTFIPHLGRACGLAINKDENVGFISGKDVSNQEFKKFGTQTRELKEVTDGYKKTTIMLANRKYRVFYFDVFVNNITEMDIEVIMANPVHFNQVPTLTTYCDDTKWLFTLLHGLVRQGLFLIICREVVVASKDIY